MQPSEPRAPQGVHIDRSQVGVVGDRAHVEDGIRYNVYQHARPQPVDEAALGPEHPDTQSSRRNVAAIEERLRDDA